jgi:hypothetical protein
MFGYRPSKNKFIGSKLDILMPWGQKKIYKVQNSEKVSRFQVYVAQKLSMTEERRQIKAVCSDEEITGKKAQLQENVLGSSPCKNFSGAKELNTTAW